MGMNDGLSSYSLHGVNGDKKALASMRKNSKMVMGAVMGGWAK